MTAVRMPTATLENRMRVVVFAIEVVPCILSKFNGLAIL
jgi:hypothetical protein